jgi:hypothetical protein
MKSGAVATAVALIGLMSISLPALADGERVRGCASPAQAHELLIQQKFIAPFRALGEAMRGTQAEAVGVQLCRLGEAFVYDITLLQRDGHVGHALVNARTGVLVVSQRQAK